MARRDLISPAVRPKMNARAMFQGPQGSGKTWTMLSVARNLTAGTAGRVLGIDTERESMLTYADVYQFEHLPWRPPYDAAELTAELDALASSWVQCADDVVIIDSLSHFWQGTGGILDVAGGRVQGGWDRARPIQNALAEQLLAMPCHVLLGARMKNTVLVSDNGKTIENVGLTVIQDDTLAYEVNIVVQMDAQHACSIIKSRTPAVPVGRTYPGGHEAKLATEYADWLAGGIPPANREDVERIVQTVAGIADKDRRNDLRRAFKSQFGSPHSLTANQVADAYAWLVDQGCPVDEGPSAAVTAQAAAEQPAATTGADDPQPAAQAPPSGPTAETEAARAEALADVLKAMDGAQLTAALVERGATVAANSRDDTLRRRLGILMLEEGWQPEPVTADA